jgi:Methyltransferase domain
MATVGKSSSNDLSQNNSGTPYDQRFFDCTEATVLSSANVIVPLILGMVPAKSVVDVGCGRGAWLSVFCEHGIQHIAGYDGAYVDRSALLIPESCFSAVDLARPFHIDGNFELAVCLEVGEHLPIRSSRGLVNTLCNAAPVVLFSTAVPGQGGTHHINEQWPDFWRRLFADRGYDRIDCIRPKVWGERAVATWYRQNIVVYAHSSSMKTFPLLNSEDGNCLGADLEMVMPHVLSRYSSVAGLLRELPRALQRAFWNRFV